eukprot:334016-Prorocentrum_lima.AAC.1
MEIFKVISMTHRLKTLVICAGLEVPNSRTGNFFLTFSESTSFGEPAPNDGGLCPGSHPYASPG